jgi:hypothetical protein
MVGEDMRRLVARMMQLMLFYEMRLEYTVALTLLLTPEYLQSQWLRTKTTNHLEGLLNPRYGRSRREFVLGSEYIHVEKALSGHFVRYLPERGMSRLKQGRKSSQARWERTYSCAEFAALAERVAIWDSA